MFKRLLHIGVTALFLAACGTATPEAAGPADDDGGWVELSGDIDLDASVIERVTPAPVEPESMSLAEAQARLPFAYALPVWAPEGFVLQETVEVIQPADGLGYTSVSLTWQKADEATLHLQVTQTSDDQAALGAAGSSERVTVNGAPAVLIHTSRLGAERLALTWPRGDLTYTLTADLDAATPEDLRRMAESIS